MSLSTNPIICVCFYVRSFLLIRDHIFLFCPPRNVLLDFRLGKYYFVGCWIISVLLQIVLSFALGCGKDTWKLFNPFKA